MNGHLAQQCPNKLPTPRSGNQSRPQGQQNYTYGKVNHLTTKEAQQAQGVVLGMSLQAHILQQFYLIWEHRILYIINICCKASSAHNNYEAYNAS
jgi:hypothetical protein